MASRRKPLRKFRRFLELEKLEDRTLLTFSATGAPIWTEDGPGPIINGANVQGTTPANTQQVGAVESIGLVPQGGGTLAPRPDVLFIGTTAGGVWESTNANTATPTWNPLGDQLPALSMGGIAVSPFDNTPSMNLVDATTDPSNLVIFAGTAAVSSAGPFAGASMGVLKSTDGGATWSLKGTDVFPQGADSGFQPLGIRTIVATTIKTPQGELLFAATPNVKALPAASR
jgi:hypothetical protein